MKILYVVTHGRRGGAQKNVLDLALGIGGIPRGRVIEIYGPESSGKTTLAMHCIAESQKSGGMAAFIDAEHAFDKQYAENLGIDTARNPHLRYDSDLEFEMLVCMCYC